MKLQALLWHISSKDIDRVGYVESATQLRSGILGERMQGYVVDRLKDTIEQILRKS
jgi:hypothetical protein